MDVITQLTSVYKEWLERQVESEGTGLLKGWVRGAFEEGEENFVNVEQKEGDTRGARGIHKDNARRAKRGKRRGGKRKRRL